MKHHRIYFSLLSLFLPLTIFAQHRLRTPLTYLPGDSVVTWTADITDFRSPALEVDRTLREQHVEAERLSKRKLRRSSQEWEEMVAAQDIIGGAGQADAEEQCRAAVMLVDRSAQLFLQTGEARFVDAMERPLFNLLPALTVARDGEEGFARHVAAQTLFNAAGMVYATDKCQSLYVNFYLNSTTRIAVPGMNMIVDQLTAMPHDGRVKIRFSGYSTARRLRLYLRIPAWACDSTPAAQMFAYIAEGKNHPEIFVNGRDVLQMSFENGYAVIDRKWNSGDEVMINFPLVVQHLRKNVSGTMQRGEVAVQRGPLVYAADAAALARESYYYSTNSPLCEDKTPNVSGHTRLIGNIYSITNTPADASARPISLSAEPYIDNCGTIWMKECK